MEDSEGNPAFALINNGSKAALKADSSAVTKVTDNGAGLRPPAVRIMMLELHFKQHAIINHHVSTSLKFQVLT